MKKLLLLICLSALLSYQVNAQSIYTGISGPVVALAVVVLVAIAVLAVTLVVVFVKAFIPAKKNHKRKKEQASLERILMQKLLV